MKKRKLLYYLLMALLLIGLAGCGGTKEASQPAAPEPAAPEVRTITDHVGNTMELTGEVERVVVCDIYPLPSVLSVFFDSAEKLVGIPQQSMAAAKNGLLGELYPEILTAETGYIDGSEVNIEELMKLEPDIVFYSSGSDASIGQQLRDAGIPGFAVSAGKWNYNAIETLNNWIASLSEIFPAETERAEAVKAYSDEVYNRVQERVADIPDEEKEKLFFLFQYSDSNLTTSGRQFFGQWWADAINAVNVGEEMETVNSTPVTMEQVYAWNPQHILITNFNSAQPKDLLENTVGSYDWSGIDAVVNGKVDKMPLGMYRSYTCGADTPVTLLWMAKTVYPALFEDVDITEETKAYYKTVFGVELTDEQANRIFAPSSAASAF